MSSSSKAVREMKDIVFQITPDFEVEMTKKCHFKVKLFRGGKSASVIVAGTPGDRRNLMNFRADIRRTYAALA